jgi:hypothetical protein
MVSHTRGSLGAPDKIVSSPEAPRAGGFGERVLDRLCEAICGLSGHENLMQFRQDRMFLKCVSCGHESPGWSLKEPSPTPATRGDGRRRPAIASQLVGARKVA